MNLNRFFQISLYLLLYSSSAEGQSANAIVEGRVINNSGKGISNSKISLLSASDTTLYNTVSGIDGKFTINQIKTFGRYIIVIENIGFAKFIKVLNFTGQYNNIGKLVMVDSLLFMKEVIISNKRKSFINKNDTIEYDAKYFKTHADMDAIYLLNKMPGFDLSGGIKVDGDTNSKLAINGILYFGDDPRKILVQIPAAVIEKIQVYDDSTINERLIPNKIFKTSKIINIVTRNDYFSKPKGVVYGGLSHNLLYVAGGNLLVQNSKMQLSITGASNKGKIPYNKFFDPAAQYESSGLPATNDLNVNLTKNLSKRTKFNIDYSLNNIQNTRVENSTYRYLNNSITKISNSNNADYCSIRNSLNMKISNIKKSRNISYNLSARISEIQNNNHISTINERFENSYTSLRKNKGYGISNTINYNNSILKSKKVLSLKIPFGYSINEENSNIRGTNITSDTIIKSNFRNENNSEVLSLSPEASILIPVNSSSQVTIRLLNTNNIRYNSQNKLNYSIISNDYSDTDSLYSKSIKSSLSNTVISSTYALKYKKHTIGVSGDLSRIKIKGNTIQKLSFTRIFINPNAKIEYKYALSNTRNIALTIESKNEIPQFEDLNPLLNYNDNFSFSIGNNNISPPKRFDFRLTYDSKSVSKESFMSVTMSSIYIKNSIQENFIIPFANAITYAEHKIQVGEQLKYKDNSSDYKNINCNINYDFPFRLIKSTIKLKSNSSYTGSGNQINYQSLYNHNFETQLSSQISSVISKKIDFNIYAMYKKIIFLNGKNVNRNIDNYSLNTFLIYDIIKNTNVKLETNFNTIRSKKYSINSNFFVADITLSKKILKKKQMAISLLAHDIFNSYNKYSIENKTGYTVDIISNNIKRYFLVMLTYNY